MTGTSDQPDFVQQVSNSDTNALIKLVALAKKQMTMRKDNDLSVAYEKYVKIAQKINVSAKETIAVGQTKPNETWTRRGKHPRWLATQLAGGKTLTDFLITKTA